MKTAPEHELLLGKPPRPGQAQEAGTPSGPRKDPVADVTAIIAGLADGNCAKASDVRLVTGYSEVRAVDLKMTVGIGWAADSKAYAGTPPVPGSRLCGDTDDTQRYLSQVCGAACRDPATSRQVAAAIAKAPIDAFDTLKDKYRIGSLPHAAHQVADCGNCGGDGQVTCTGVNCVDGRVQCFACAFTGKATCTRCSGTGDMFEGGRYFCCRQCGGTGRSGNCHMCRGTRYVDCSHCRGTGWLGCNPCARTGRITHAYSTHTIGRLARSIVHAAGAPDGFRRSCQAVSPLISLASPPGALVRAEVSPGAGEVGLVLHLAVQHVHAEFTCDLEHIEVDALGPGLTIPLMPTFLDGLTTELAYGILTASEADPAHALILATSARLTRDILAAIGRGVQPNPTAVKRSWRGAVSEGHAGLLVAHLRQAYAKAGRSPVRRTWLLMSPVIVVATVLANAYQEPGWLLYGMITRLPNAPAPVQLAAIGVAEAVTAFPALLVTWIIASRAGRRRLRTGLGSLAQRGPPQGKWPLLGIMFAMAVGWTAVAMRLDAAPMGLLWASASRPGGRSMAQAFDMVFGGRQALAPGPPPSAGPGNATASRRQPERARRD